MPQVRSPTVESRREGCRIDANNQVAGVDEGGIVKLHGNYLVVLAGDGFLPIAVGGDRLRPVSVANAFGGEIDPNGTWYDEMLISAKHGRGHRIQLRPRRYRGWAFPDG